jgi:hypothetical protein
LSTPPPPGAGDPDEPDLAAAVALRLAGYAEAEAVRRQELRDLTDEEAAIIADGLLQLLPLLADEPDRGSGLVEQQRWFSRIRRREAIER